LRPASLNSKRMSINYSNVPSPSFVLEEKRLIRNLELIAGVQEKAGVSIILALKGFAMWRTFPLVAKYLKGATASSLHEARLIYEEMGTQAHTYSPAYLPGDFEELMRYSSHITFNSLQEYTRYKDRLTGSGISPGLRVNPEYSDVEVALYNPASPQSRLGVLTEDLENGLPDGIEGLHFHTLCESSAEALEQTLAAFVERFGRFLPQVKWVNLGGGHLMTHKDYNIEHLIQVLTTFKQQYPHLKVIMEPGSAIAWETGELVTTVLDIVHHRGLDTAIVDVSFTAHMPDTLEMPYRPKILGATDPQEGKPTYRIGGVSCLAGDFMDAYSFEEKLKIGDRLVFWDMIHYTMVKTTTFNGVQHPSICIWKQNNELEVVKKFEYGDFMNRLS
jgi:carboxynorspermidine decarboxylase